MNERNEQIKAVLSDEVFVKSLLEAENEEAVQKMLADKGVEMSLTEIELMGEMLEGIQDGRITAEQLETLTKQGELSADDLEEVAGGNWQAIKEALFYETTRYGKTIENAVTGSSITESGTFQTLSANKIGLCIIAVAGIGYGIYDAVRRRW